MPKGQEKEVSKTSPSHSPSSQKDIRVVSNTFEILDGHVVKTNPFGANITGENSYRRAERIGAALHLITNHVPENEPIRVSIRKGGIELLDHILELRTGFRPPGSEKVQAVLAKIRHLVSLVRLLAVSGFVSAENVNALAEALDELGSLIVASQRSSLAEQLTITREDLQPPAVIQNTTSGTFREERVPNRFKAKKYVKDIKDRSRAITQAPSGARADQIMDILRLGGMLGIKDISANLPQYSEKMIQRELADLVLANKINKTGEKRWSRYQVVAA